MPFTAVANADNNARALRCRINAMEAYLLRWLNLLGWLHLIMGITLDRCLVLFHLAR
jgi:hypothetical protein